MVVARSRRYKSAAEGINPNSPLTVEEAVKTMKAKVSAKFDESVELSIKLDIDTKQSDQLVRGSMSLPQGTGKSLRVIAFAEGEEAEAAKANGAVEVGAKDLADKVGGGWMEFDIAIAHPSMMRFVGKLGKVLGPKGLMPSPKSGTVTEKVAQAVKEFSAGKIEFRNDKEGNIHLLVGKASFEEAALVENINAAIAHIRSIRPTAVKGEYVTGIHISSTMGPGLPIVAT